MYYVLFNLLNLLQNNIKWKRYDLIDEFKLMKLNTYSEKTDF